MATPETTDPRTTLAAFLADRPDLAAVAAAIFDYTQYLLDDDERLTKSGALDGEGRELLRARALETLGGVAFGSEAEDEADDSDDDEADEVDEGEGEGEGDDEGEADGEAGDDEAADDD